MNNYKQENKSLSKDIETSKQSTSINISGINEIPFEVARVSTCLTSKHTDCNGKYIDSFKGKYLIKCLCECHNNRSQKEDDNLNNNSDIFYSRKLDDSLLNLTKQERNKPYSSILDEICWCGHERNYHSGLNQCREKDCNCLEFSP